MLPVAVAGGHLLLPLHRMYSSWQLGSLDVLTTKQLAGSVHHKSNKKCYIVCQVLNSIRSRMMGKLVIACRIHRYVAAPSGSMYSYGLRTFYKERSRKERGEREDINTKWVQRFGDPTA